MTATPKSKKTINYAHIFLHYKATVETLLTHHKAPQEIINKTIDLVRDFLKQEIILMCCHPTSWEKQASIPIVEGKSIIDSDTIERIELEIIDLIGGNLASELMDILDELMLSDTTLSHSNNIYRRQQFSSWDVMDVDEGDGCTIKFINYGDYRVLAWEYMVKGMDEEVEEKSIPFSTDENPSQADIQRLLVETDPMTGLEERMTTNPFDRKKRKR